MKKFINETIYDGKTVKCSYPDIQHIEIRGVTDVEESKWAFAITRHTKYSTVIDDWENAIFIPNSEVEEFLKGWAQYIQERDMGTLKDLSDECTAARPFRTFRHVKVERE